MDLRDDSTFDDLSDKTPLALQPHYAYSSTGYDSAGTWPLSDPLDPWSSAWLQQDSDHFNDIALHGEPFPTGGQFSFQSNDPSDALYGTEYDASFPNQMDPPLLQEFPFDFDLVGDLQAPASGSGPVVQDAPDHLSVVVNPQTDAQKEHHYPFTCELCPAWSWRTRYTAEGLARHRDARHSKCQECGKMLISNQARAAHMRTEHSTIWRALCTCAECGEAFSTPRELSIHAQSQSHAAYACKEVDCTSKFTRYPDYERHLDQHLDDVKKFPCKHCRKHRGVDGFKRKDHLTQHLRNYHHIEPETGWQKFGSRDWAYCPRPECPQHVVRQSGNEYYGDLRIDGEPPFRTQAAATQHMKKIHDESPFPCKEPGCDKVGGKGYSRKIDLAKHLKAKHPAAAGRDQTL